jgi:putative acetyltransferase
LDVHHAAVRGLAAHDYTPDIIVAWAPLPITQDAVKAVATNAGNEVRFVADRDGRVIG